MAHFPREFASSFLADITSRMGFRWVEDYFRSAGEKTIEKVGEAVKERKEKVEKYRRDYAGCIAEMDEPFRTLLNNQYRSVRIGRIGIDEDIFVELMMKKLDIEGSREERKKYLEYFAKLRRYPRPDLRDCGVLYPSIEEELDKFYDGSLREEVRRRRRARWGLRKATSALNKRLANEGELRWNIFTGFYRSSTTRTARKRENTRGYLERLRNARLRMPWTLGR